MSSAAQGIHSYDSSSQSVSAGALLMLLQMLPQLQLERDRAEQEVKRLRRTLEEEAQRFHQREHEYIKKISLLEHDIQNAHDERDHIKNILVNTTTHSQNLQQEANILATNFSIEKDKVMQIFTEKNNFILTHSELLKNVSKELKSLILDDTSDEEDNEIENESNYEHDIKNSLANLKEMVKKLKTDLFEKESETNEAKEKIEEMEEEAESCKETNKDLQEELNVAKEAEEELQQVKFEKEQLQNLNEKLLRQILSVLETSTQNQNVMMEKILKESSSASRGIQKYIVEPVEKAYNLTIKLILNNRTKQQALIEAAQKGNETEISLLLDDGADIEGDDQTNRKYRPLHWAADKGQREATRLLILRGADVNARTGLHNTSALHIAVLKEHLGVIDLLLKAGANIEAQDSDGSTPLLWAAGKHDCEIGRLLVERGADVSTTNANDVSAVSRGPVCLKQLLCSKGARDHLCSTPETTTTTVLPTVS